MKANDDYQRFNAVFANNLAYSASIEGRVKEWVSANIDRWLAERRTLEWFNIELIDDKFLPKDIYLMMGGLRRRRSTVGLREVLISKEKGVAEANKHIDQMLELTATAHMHKVRMGMWKTIAEEVYKQKSNNFKSNFVMLQRVFLENAELFAPLIERCPNFRVILSFILEDRFGFKVERVEWTLDSKEWGKEECKRIGCSLATFLRKRKTGDAAIAAWKLHYTQLGFLFANVDGFEEVSEKKNKKKLFRSEATNIIARSSNITLRSVQFMLTIANNLLQDSIYGMVYRVSLGAALSTFDAATDIYVITTYYQSDKLGVQGERAKLNRG